MSTAGRPHWEHFGGRLRLTVPVPELSRRARFSEERQGHRWPAVLPPLFVAAGTIKSSSLLDDFRPDLTLIVALVIVLASVRVFLLRLLNGQVIPGAGWLSAAFTAAVLGLFVPVYGPYAATKLPALFALTLGCGFGGALLLIRTHGQRTAALWATIGTGLIVALLASIAPATGVELRGRMALVGAATIGPARVLAAAALVLIVLASARRVRALVAVPLVVVLLGMTVQTGSRGPLAALIAAILAGLPFIRRELRKRAVLLLAVVAAAGYHVVINVSVNVQERLLALVAADFSSSESVRLHLWEETAQIIARNPWGVGWGGLSSFLSPVTDYPHNLLFEVAGEGGIVVAAALLGVVVVALRRATRVALAGDATALAVLCLIIYWFANAMVSGDINDSRGLFIAMGIALAMDESPSPSNAPNAAAFPAIPCSYL